jgi:hypothetical protein
MPVLLLSYLLSLDLIIVIYTIVFCYYLLSGSCYLKYIPINDLFIVRITPGDSVMSFQSCYLKVFMYVIIGFLFHRVYWFRGRGTHLLGGEGVGGPKSEEGTDTVVL